MITKKDWEQVLEATKADKERMQRGYELSMPQFDAIIEFCNKKISEFPTEVPEDPMPEEVKDIVKAL